MTDFEACLPANLRRTGATITRIGAGLSGAGVYRVEGPGVNDPSYDLATIALFLRMDEPGCLALLSAHDGTPATPDGQWLFGLALIKASMTGPQ